MNLTLILIYHNRKILDDLAGDAPVKMENYEENGSSSASSPGGPEELTEKQVQQVQQAQQQAAAQYQSIQLNGVIAPPSNAVVQLNDGQVSQLNIQFLVLKGTYSLCPHECE